VSTSAIPATKAALVVMLVGADGLSGVQVAWGDPGDMAQIPPERVLVGQARSVQRAAGFLPTRRVEDFSIEVVIRAELNADQTTASGRAYELLGAIEGALRADRTIGGSIDVAQVASFEDREEVTERGRLCTITAQVECTAQI
jgi:hypothetical protein